MLAQVTLLQSTHRTYNDECRWAIQRRITSTFIIPIRPVANAWEALAEEAFHITNAPEELLSEPQKEWERIHHKTRAGSLSVNDVVQVTHPHGTEFFLCRSSGWESVWQAPTWEGHEALSLLFSNLVTEYEFIKPHAHPRGTCPTCNATHYGEE